MKKFLVQFFCVLVAVLLISCASTATVDYSSAVYKGARGDQPVYEYKVLEEDQRNPAGVYTIPFTENAVEVAMKTRTMRVYFMAGDRWLMANGIDKAYLGDSTLIVFPDGQTMLIDGGRSEYAPVLVENLRKLGIEKLDYVLLSHMHNDHYGVLWTAKGIFYNFPVTNIIWQGSYNMSAEGSFHSAIDRYGIKLIQVKAGDSLDIGDVRVDIYNPSGEYAGQALAEAKLNNESIAAKITYGDFSAMFCGDLYVEGEWDVIKSASEGDLDVELLKASHHGFDTSNSKEWAAATTPRVVWVPGTPTTTTYGGYSKVGGRVYTYFLDGYLRVVTDGYNCEVTATSVRETRAFDGFDKIVETLYPGTFTSN